jgi:hypothetical protein
MTSSTSTRSTARELRLVDELAKVLCKPAVPLASGVGRELNDDGEEAVVVAFDVAL